jgi:hypothetical protein
MNIAKMRSLAQVEMLIQTDTVCYPKKIKTWMVKQ